MPLDAADFISQLSITDPVGTDPLNQGDDQIRTVKRATQQSFPNIDAPVPQTAAQMAQMAIKNEENTFTLKQFFLNRVQIDGQLTEADGLALAPAYSFTTDPATGMYIQGASQLGFAVAGVERFRVSNTNVTLRAGMLQFRNINGTTAAPGYSFNDNTNMGMYRAASNVLAWATEGVQRMTLTGTEFQVFTNIRSSTGVDATAAFGFTQAPGTGMSRGTGGALNFAVDGTRRLQITAVNSRFGFRQDGATGGVSLSLENSAGVIAYSIDYEGTAGFQPGQFSISRFNRTTGAFIDIPLYINATTGRVHTALPVLSP